jgi:hypothetical protein
MFDDNRKKSVRTSPSIHVEKKGKESYLTTHLRLHEGWTYLLGFVLKEGQAQEQRICGHERERFVCLSGRGGGEEERKEETAL